MIQLILAKSIGILGIVLSIVLRSIGCVSEVSFFVLFLFSDIVLVACEYLQYVDVLKYRSNSAQDRYINLLKEYNRLKEENAEYEITIRTLGSVGNGDYIRMIGTLSDMIEDSRYEKIKSKLPKDSSIEEIIISCIRDLVSEVNELQE